MTQTSSRSSSQNAWEKLQLKHKNILRAPQSVYIYNKKEEYRFINSRLCVEKKISDLTN